MNGTDNDFVKSKIAEIYITQKERLVFNCSSPCSDRLHFSLQEFLQHISQHHGYNPKDYDAADNVKLFSKKSEVLENENNIFSEENILNWDAVDVENSSGTCTADLLEEIILQEPLEWQALGESIAEEKDSKTLDEEVSTSSQNNARHVQKDEQHKCHICALTWRHLSSLDKHIFTEHSDKERIVGKTHKCEFCAAAFCTRLNLKKHVLQNHSELSHTCEICGHAFKEKHNLKQHLNRHLGVKKFTCRQCDKSFCTTTELKIHGRSHSGERSFVCEECGQRFAHSWMLVGHMKRHTNTRLHKCEYCNERFFEYYDKKKHLLVHMKKNKHTCNMCNASYKRKCSLKRHVQTH